MRGFIPVSHQNSQTSKETEISIYLGYSVLCWLTKSFNLQSQIHCWSVLKDFFRLLCCFLPSSYGTLCLANWIYSEQALNVSRNAHMNFFLQPNPFNYKILTLKTNSWLLPFCTGMVHLKLCGINKVCPALKASNILYIQCRNIIFPTKRAKVTNKLLIAKL